MVGAARAKHKELAATEHVNGAKPRGVLKGRFHPFDAKGTCQRRVRHPVLPHIRVGRVLVPKRGTQK